MAPTSDGSTDASLADADAGPPFCSTVDAGFCDDFDGKPLTTKWDSIDGDGGTLSTSDTAFVSPPNSLLVEAPAVDAGPARELVLNRRIASTAGHVNCQLALRIDAMGPNAVRVLEYEMIAPNGNSFYFGFYAGPNNAVGYADTFTSNGTAIAHKEVNLGGALSAFTLGTWHSIAVNLDFNAANDGQLRFTFDGNERPAQGVLPFVDTASVRVYLGIENDDDGFAIKYRVDDFACSVD